MGLTPPGRLAPDDDISRFACGAPVVDDWLRARARASLERGSAVTYVVKDMRRVVAFYTLSASAVDRIRIGVGRLRRNSPNPIPVLLLGQLGVDREYQHRGLAAALLRDAMIRSVTVAREVGVQALLVEAIELALVPWYRRFGFEPISTAEPTVLMLRTKDIRTALLELGN